MRAWSESMDSAATAQRAEAKAHRTAKTTKKLRAVKRSEGDDSVFAKPPALRACMAATLAQQRIFYYEKMRAKAASLRNKCLKTAKRDRLQEALPTFGHAQQFL